MQNYFQEYKKAGDPSSGPSRIIFRGYRSSNFILFYTFATTDIRVETEAWAFSTISFIAELGGALSLFVGVSFLSLWDCAEFIVEKYKTKIKTKNEAATKSSQNILGDE